MKTARYETDRLMCFWKSFCLDQKLFHVWLPVRLYRRNPKIIILFDAEIQNRLKNIYPEKYSLYLLHVYLFWRL